MNEGCMKAGKSFSKKTQILRKLYESIQTEPCLPLWFIRCRHKLCRYTTAELDLLFGAVGRKRQNTENSNKQGNAIFRGKILENGVTLRGAGVA